MVFKQDLKIFRKKADGSPGFVKVKHGHTPESYGFEPEDIEDLVPLLMDGEGAAESNPFAPDEAIEQLTVEQMIAFAIAAMLKEDPKKKDKKLWMKNGKPRVEHIEQMIDENITEAQRDEAWAIYQKEGDNK